MLIRFLGGSGGGTICAPRVGGVTTGLGGNGGGVALRAAPERLLSFLFLFLSNFSANLANFGGNSASCPSSRIKAGGCVGGGGVGGAGARLRALDLFVSSTGVGSASDLSSSTCGAGGAEGAARCCGGQTR